MSDEIEPIHHVPETKADRDRRHMDAVTTVFRGSSCREIKQKLYGRTYIWNEYGTCNTCALGYETIRQVHLKLLDGIQITQIRRALDMPEGDKPSYGSLLNHAHNHFSLGYKVGILESKLGDMMGMTPMEAAEHPMEQVSSEAVARLILTKATSLFSQGILEVKTSDLINVAKLVREIEQEDKGVDEARYFAQAMTLVLGEAQKTLPSDDFDAMIWRLQTNPDMQRILKKVSGQPEEADMPPPAHASLEPPAPVIEATASEDSSETSLMSVIA